MTKTVDQEIDDLIGQLSLFPNAVIGHGFRHPIRPDPTSESEYHLTLTQYPFLERDAGYLAFLRRYAGAAVYSHPDADITIHLFGFINDVFHLLNGPGQTVDHEGFMALGYTEFSLKEPHQNVITLGFSFDATRHRPPGIYRSIRQPGGEIRGPEWYCASFIEWLRLTIATRGRLLE